MAMHCARRLAGAICANRSNRQSQNGWANRGVARLKAAALGRRLALGHPVNDAKTCAGRARGQGGERATLSEIGCEAGECAMPSQVLSPPEPPTRTQGGRCPFHKAPRAQNSNAHRPRYAKRHRRLACPREECLSSLG